MWRASARVERIAVFDNDKHYDTDLKTMVAAIRRADVVVPASAHQRCSSRCDELMPDSRLASSESRTVHAAQLHAIIEE